MSRFYVDGRLSQIPIPRLVAYWEDETTVWVGASFGTKHSDSILVAQVKISGRPGERLGRAFDFTYRNWWRFRRAIHWKPGIKFYSKPDMFDCEVDPR